MARLPLLGGAYSARSIIANCQRCINLYPEQNSEDAPVPITHYQRAGLRPLVQDSSKLPVRGLYRASNGNGFAVIGQKVYYVAPSWRLVQLGELATAGSVPVSFTDNGTTILLVDSSSFGYTIQLADNSFAKIDDSTGIFTGATRVDTMDGFVLWNVPGTRQWGSTLDNEIVFDPTYIASKSTYPDPLQTLVVNRHELLLLGQLKSEIFYNAGNSLFPFAQLPGAYIEHGTVAPYSVASQDINVYWVGQDLQGQGVVFRQRGYNTTRISNHALEYSLQQIAKRATLQDAIGFTYQQGGHAFYQLEFPSGNETWVFDEALGGNPNIAWHQQCWTDGNGTLNRDRLNCCAFFYGTNVGGDWSNGTLYSIDPDYYFDTVDGSDYSISYIRTFPHIGVGTAPNGMPMLADGKRIEFTSFMADFECGTTAATLDGRVPEITLRWSDDRGRTYGNGVLQPAGAIGEYLTRPTWRAAGIARDRVFELEYSFGGPAALNGAWVEGKVLGT